MIICDMGCYPDLYNDWLGFLLATTKIKEECKMKSGKNISILTILAVFFIVNGVFVNTTQAEVFDFAGTYYTTNRPETITIRKVNLNQFEVKSTSGWDNVSLLDGNRKVLWGVYRDSNGVCGYHRMEHIGQNIVKVQTIGNIGAKPHEWFINKQ